MQFHTHHRIARDETRSCIYGKLIMQLYSHPTTVSNEGNETPSPYSRRLDYAILWRYRNSTCMFMCMKAPKIDKASTNARLKSWNVQSRSRKFSSLRSKNEVRIQGTELNEFDHLNRTWKWTFPLYYKKVQLTFFFRAARSRSWFKFTSFENNLD